MGFDRRLVAAAAAVVAVVFAPTAVSANAQAEHSITLTFVRHAQSAGNASGLIDTSTPGPGITEQGYQQAVDVTNQLHSNDYDGIYASTMVRTQETAAPMSRALNEPATIVPGLREIEAGIYEGQPEADAAQYFSAAVAWLHGDRNARIPGSVDGNEFDARFDDAVETIYDSGDVNPVAYSHAAAIMVWVLMNVKNPDTSLLTNDPLPNTGHVVVVGSPREGWTLTDWNGISVPR